ncbi:hypothetical protein HWV62_23673 [Athelia sp. TMB]|nr:hypothetical protein HWV62_23673 [Athelia sp. TMB]
MLVTNYTLGAAIDRHAETAQNSETQGDSDSDSTLVVDESSSDESSMEESTGSDEDSGEAEWESSDASNTPEMRDISSNSAGENSPPPGVITQNVQETEDTDDSSAGDVSRGHGMVPHPISLDTRIPLPEQEASELVHPGNRIMWQEERDGDEIPGAPSLDPNPMPVRKRRRSPSSSSDEEIVISHHTRRRSPSVEIISYMDRREARRTGAAAARRERRRLFMEEALRTDGFVFTGFRIVHAIHKSYMLVCNHNAGLICFAGINVFYPGSALFDPGLNTGRPAKRILRKPGPSAAKCDGFTMVAYREFFLTCASLLSYEDPSLMVSHAEKWSDEELKYRLTQAFRFMPALGNDDAENDRAMQRFQQGISYEFQQFCAKIGEIFSRTNDTFIFPGFIHAGMEIDWHGGVERTVMEEYRAQWFPADDMEIDSFDFANAWWKGPLSKTLPCTSWYEQTSRAARMTKAIEEATDMLKAASIIQGGYIRTQSDRKLEIQTIISKLQPAQWTAGSNVSGRLLDERIGAGLIAHAQPVPVPGLVNFVRDAVKLDDASGLSAIRDMLSTILPMKITFSGWWAPNQSTPPVFPAKNAYLVEKYDQHQESLSRLRARIQEILEECRRLRVSLESDADKAEREALEVDILQAQMLVWAGLDKNKGV